MINIAYIALGLAIFFITRTVFSDEEKRSAGRQLGNYRADAPDAGNIILRASRPIFSRYLVPIVEDLKVDKTRKILKKKLASAGLTEALTPDELYSFKLFLSLSASRCSCSSCDSRGRWKFRRGPTRRRWRSATSTPTRFGSVR